MYETKPNDPLFIDDVLTPLSESEATYYLREAYKVVLGSYPSIDSLAILWAQTALECARWKSLHFNNWGNIKKLPGIRYTSFKCNEVINGKLQWFYSYHPQTFFAAWESHLDGASAYLSFLANRSRYARAWEQIKAGDAVQYCTELKKAGYFTADLGQYTRGVVSLTNEFKKKSATLLAWKPESAGESNDTSRQSQLPTVVPSGDDPLEQMYPIHPLDMPDFHPDQENIKNIPVPAQSIGEILIRVFESLQGLFAK